jgi:hypothetical protein
MSIVEVNKNTVTADTAVTVLKHLWDVRRSGFPDLPEAEAAGDQAELQ